MVDETPCALTLSDAAAAIAAGRLSAREATEACLARLARHGAKLGCLAGIEPEAALAAARAADDELAAGHRRGPLHGVPLAHKDMFYRAGRVSACGSRIRADYRPAVTATVLQRLDAAGALDIARLAMVEFALGTSGHNEITGTPGNPWNPAHIPGGSSSGSAVAVAGRMAFGALGSDTGGSIRLPAACCNLVGLKPTYGRVSRFGAMPLSFSLDTIGPLARSATDVALILRAIAGRDPQDPTSSDRPVPDYAAGLERGIRGLKIAVPVNYFYEALDDEVRRLMERSHEVLRALGAELLEVALPDSIAAANDLTMLIISVEGAAFHARWLRERPQDYGRQTYRRLLPGLLQSATRYLEAVNLRQAVLADLQAAVFERADLLHAPVWSRPIPTIAESDPAVDPGFAAASGRCVRPFNFVGLPAVSVPAGLTANGLPSAFQLVGRPFDEALLLRAAWAFERETGWTKAAPPLE